MQAFNVHQQILFKAPHPPCRSRDSVTSPPDLKRRKSRTELIRQLSKQKSVVSNMVDEEMPEQKTTLIQEEKAETGVVSSGCLSEEGLV